MSKINEVAFFKIINSEGYKLWQMYIVLSYASCAVFWDNALHAERDSNFYQKFVDECIEKTEYKRNKVERNLKGFMKNLLRLCSEHKRKGGESLLNCFVTNDDAWTLIEELMSYCKVAGLDFLHTNFLHLAEKVVIEK